MSAPRILLVSNGFGEIAITECIARAIASLDAAAVLAHLPLVGKLPADAFPAPVGPQFAMPSGGLVTYWNFRNIARDLAAGLAGATLRQFAFLRSHRRDYDAIAAIGDVFCLAACLTFARLPAVFVATAKSEYVAGHSRLERGIAKKAKATFARDAVTARSLARSGIPARYAGNVMMDCIAGHGIELPIDPAATRIAVLPGSREDAAENARAAARRLKRIAAIGKRKIQAFLAPAPAVGAAKIIDAFAAEGLAATPNGSSAGVVARGRTDDVEVVVVAGDVGDVLRAAQIVLGQAGTGNEQAAGLGKPVIAAAGADESPQSMGWYRMRQQRLLGDALLVLDGAADDAFAAEVVRLLADPDRIERMATSGKERMGGTGAAASIAHAILDVAGQRT